MYPFLFKKFSVIKKGMMHKNKIWLFFLLLLTLGTLFSLGRASVSLIQYNKLALSTKPASIVWGVEEITEEHFAPLATYTFVYKGHTYQGQDQAKEHHARSAKGVEIELASLTKKPQRIYFDPKHPQVSALQKHFPVKESATSCLLLLLLLYFLGLGLYVGRQTNRTFQ